MSEHTPEPWIVSEESFDNGGIQETVIRGLDGRAAVAVTLEFGPNNPGMREANARRIVACVNACAGLSTVELELISVMGERVQAKCVSDGYKQQRDGLLAALKLCADAMLDKGVLIDPEHPHRIALNAADALIAEFKGECK